MRAYGLAYRETMSLPVPVFWHLSGSVPRLLTGERKDTLELMVTSAHNPDGASELYKRLNEASPDPVKLTGNGQAAIGSERDEEGFNELRSMV